MKTFILAALLTLTAVSATVITFDQAAAGARRGGSVAGSAGKW